MAHRVQQPEQVDSRREIIGEINGYVRKVDFVVIGKRALFLLLFALMGLVYFIVNAEGLRILAPQFAKDLMFGLDLAHPFIFVVLVFTAICTHQIVLAFKGLDDEFEAPPTQKIFTVFGVVFIGFDAILFYLGSTSRALSAFGNGEGVSWPMILLTVVYVMILLGIGYLGVSAFSKGELK